MLDNREMNRHYTKRSRILSSRKGEKTKNILKNLSCCTFCERGKGEEKIPDLTRRGESNVLV